MHDWILKSSYLKMAKGKDEERKRRGKEKTRKGKTTKGKDDERKR